MGMDKALFQAAQAYQPPMNEAVVNGLAVHQMKYLEQWFDNAIRVVAADFPPGLVYKGMEPCSPVDEYMKEPRQKLRTNASKSTVDVAQSDIYMVNLNFELNGKPLDTKPFFLPYTSAAASIMLSGSRFFISPVLSDIVFSYEQDKIFARFTRDKFSIYRLEHSAVIDDVKTDRMVSWAVLYHDNSERSKTAKAREQRKISLMHYLCIKYGFEETFRKYGKCDVKVGNEGEINEFSHPPADWVICKSSKPTGKLFPGYSSVVLAIPRKQYEKHEELISTMVVAFFYTADRFPINLNKDQILDPKRYQWKITMGKSLWDTSRREVEMPDDIDKHFSSLDKYVDDLLRPSLERIGLKHKNLYDLMAHIIEHMHEWQIETPKRSISMYDKELTVLYELFGSFKSSFIPKLFKFYFDVWNEHYKALNARQEGLTEQTVNKLLKEHIKPRMVFFIRNESSNVSSMTYSGDNKFFKITSNLVQQKDGGRRETGNEAPKRVHTSIADIGSFLVLTKKSPNGQTRINPYINLEENMYVMPSENCKALLQDTQTRLDAAIRNHATISNASLRASLDQMDDIENMVDSD